MKDLLSLLSEYSLLLITVLIQYRLPDRILGRKHGRAVTFSIMLASNLAASWLNVSVGIATSTGGNVLYYGVVHLLLCLLLFEGSTVKKVFLTVLIACGLPIPIYILLPVIHCFFSVTSSEFMVAIVLAQYVSMILGAVGLEYAGRRFQNLRRELPVGYTVYLTGVILFVYVAIYASYERTLLGNHYELTPLSALASIAFALAGTAIVWIAIFAVDRQVHVSLQAQLYALQAESLKSREIEWRRFSGFRHDIKNHLICLSGLLQSEKTEQAVAYTRNLTDTVTQFDSPVQTGNDYADALLNVKYAEATAAKIAVSIDMAIPPSGYLNPVDLCCILSNALDNAIAACSRLAEGERWITARGFIKQGQFVIVIKNSKPTQVSVVNGEVFPKEITADHGLGLDTVRAVVEQYGGVMTLSADDAFSFGVLLPRSRL